MINYNSDEQWLAVVSSGLSWLRIWLTVVNSGGPVFRHLLVLLSRHVVHSPGPGPLALELGYDCKAGVRWLVPVSFLHWFPGLNAARLLYLESHYLGTPKQHHCFGRCCKLYPLETFPKLTSCGGLFIQQTLLMNFQVMPLFDWPMSLARPTSQAARRQ